MRVGGEAVPGRVDVAGDVLVPQEAAAEPVDVVAHGGEAVVTLGPPELGGALGVREALGLEVGGAGVDGAAGAEHTARGNRAAFDELVLTPAILAGSAEVDLTDSIAGREFALPVGMIPRAGRLLVSTLWAARSGSSVGSSNRPLMTSLTVPSPPMQITASKP